MLVLFPHQGLTLFILKLSFLEILNQQFKQEFKIQKVWILVDLPYGKKAIGTKWVCRNKKDERGVMVRNKPWLVAQGHRQEEGIDYDEVFAPVGPGRLTCLIAKATIDESNKWHRRLGHVNIKNLNKLMTGNVIRGLPSKIFQNDHTYVACQKGKQHKASYMSKSLSSISHSLQLLYMD
ncbi:putative ribonuclease H-like domain-containing protein [Tanacetum coccineum]